MIFSQWNTRLYLTHVPFHEVKTHIKTSYFERIVEKSPLEEMASVV